MIAFIGATKGADFTVSVIGLALHGICLEKTLRVLQSLKWANAATSRKKVGFCEGLKDQHILSL